MTRPNRVEQSYSLGKLASHNTAVWKAAVGPGSCLAKVPVRYTGMRPPARIMATCRAESQCDVRLAALRVRLRGVDVAGVVQPLRQRLSGQPVTDATPGREVGRRTGCRRCASMAMAATTPNPAANRTASRTWSALATVRRVVGWACRQVFSLRLRFARC